MPASPTPAKYRILAYGFEKKGLHGAPASLDLPRCTVTFGNFSDSPRFQDFDGVIFFQGIFETFENRRSNSYRGDTYLHHQWHENELDRRFRETAALIKKGGLVCTVLTDLFLDRDHDGREWHDYSRTDLAKRLLGDMVTERRNFTERTALIRSQFDELGSFFELFGAACTRLTPKPNDRQCRVLAKTSGGAPVAIATNDHIFALPSMIPKAPELEEFVTTLLTGVVTLWERFKQELPAWTCEYRFQGEPELILQKAGLLKEIEDIDSKLVALGGLKRVLAYRDEPLVDAVMDLFEKALHLKPKREEAFREDFELLDPSGVTIALVEVKGTSKGVKRENVNQADSHRERSERPHAFPSLLIVNAQMSKLATLADRDHDIATEQIQHAVQSNVLIVRTLDLINLASQRMSGSLDDGRIVRLLTESRGWLKVTSTTAEALSS